MITYGQTIRWHDRRGIFHRIEVSECKSSEEARSEALSYAKEQGWTPPRWWQRWRWRDRNYEFGKVAGEKP